MPLRCVTPKQFNTGLWFTIDPGTHTAVQEWLNGEMTMHTVIDVSKCTTLQDKIWKLEEGLHLVKYGSVIIEGVSLRTGSAVSMASGARGNLFLLSYIVGAISAILCMHAKKVYDPILFQEWAGQLSYTQLRIILKKKWGVECTNEHIAAARGIGFAAKGLL